MQVRFTSDIAVITDAPWRLLLPIDAFKKIFYYLYGTAFGALLAWNMTDYLRLRRV